MTKHDMRKGKKTGSPVSCKCQCPSMLWGTRRRYIPGCSVESTIFLACHSSGVMDLICPCLNDDISFFAFSRPAVETKRVLQPIHLAYELANKSLGSEVFAVYLPHQSLVKRPHISSPRVCNFCGLLNASPVGIEIILRGWQIAVPRK